METTVFQAVSTYQLLELMVYRKMYCNDTKAVLFMPEWLRQKIVNEEAFSEFFDKIVIFQHWFDFKNPQVGEKIEEYFDELLRKENIFIDEVQDIHIAGAQYGLGSYLCIKKIPFALWEDASKIILQPEILLGIEQGINESRAEFNNKLGLYSGDAENIEKIYASVSPDECKIAKKIQPFLVTQEMERMGGEQRKQVISVFTDVGNIDIPEKSVLLFSEHFANCKRLTFEEQVLIYQLFFDYFLADESVVIKPHPDDLMYYDQLFEKCIVIRGKFPAELLPYILSNKPKMLATISSKSINSLKNQFEETFALDNNYEKYFQFTDKYYSALVLGMKFSDYDAIRQIGTYKLLMDQLHKRNEISESGIHGNIWIVDDLNIEVEKDDIFSMVYGAGEKDVFIFINSMKNYIFSSKHDSYIWENLLPVVINKKKCNQIKDDYYANENEDIIYIYTKNREIYEEILKLEVKKELKNTGIVLEKEILDHKDIEIKILEGKLAATERRLAYYIDLVEKMEGK